MSGVASPVDRFPGVERTEHCPKCQRTDSDRHLHGLTVVTGVPGYRWICTRCGLEAMDGRDAALEMARRGQPSLGVLWDRLLADLYYGRPIDPIELARAQGRYYGFELNEDAAGLLAVLVGQMRGGVYGSAPWSAGTSGQVAAMILTALESAGQALIDAAGEVPVDECQRAALWAAKTQAHRAAAAGGPARRGDDHARAMGRWWGFGAELGSRIGRDRPLALLDEVGATLCGTGPGDAPWGDHDGEVARQVLVAITAAGYTIADVR
jgi:hypothetical protein